MIGIFPAALRDDPNLVEAYLGLARVVSIVLLEVWLT
jgi:hypothetical protein